VAVQGLCSSIDIPVLAQFDGLSDDRGRDDGEDRDTTPGAPHKIEIDVTV
jgi:hypothetical protein